MCVASCVFWAVALESIAMRVNVGARERVVLRLMALGVIRVLGYFVSQEVGTAAAALNSKWLLLRLEVMLADASISCTLLLRVFLVLLVVGRIYVI